MRLSRLFLAFPLTFGLACAQQVGDIDRTYPNKIHKSMFDGVWYFRGTVAEVNGDSPSSFEGIATELYKIRWEVTETELRGWRVNETALGVDERIDDCRRVERTDAGEIETSYDDACLRASVRQGPQLDARYRSGWGQIPDAYKSSLVISFPITSHFDVQRTYNPQTGEQTNVISENVTDRDWWERDWARISWKSPTIHSESGTFWQGSDYGDDADSDNSDHRIRFVSGAGAEVHNGKAKEGESVDYFDFAVRSMKTAYINYGGAMYPVCYFTSPSYYPVTTCDAAPVTLRFSFQRTERVPDYKPMEYGERKMGRFGFFRTEHYTRNRRRGVTESGRIYLANIHSIWEQYHVRCGAGDEQDPGCADGSGGFAEGEFKLQPVENEGVTIGYERVEIPVAQRTPKPIVYQLSPYFPQPLLEAAYNVSDSWNNAFRRVVAGAWGFNSTAEAMDGGKRVPRMFVMCENPVPAEVPERYQGQVDKETYHQLCGGEGFRYLPGDVRYHTMYWVHDRNPGSPLGYGPSSVDPETGQVMSGTAWVYGSGVDSYAQIALDYVNAMNGVITEEEIRSGAYVRDMMSHWRVPRDPRSSLPSHLLEEPVQDHLERPAMQEPLRRIREMVARGEPREALPPARPSMHRKFRQLMDETGMVDDLINDEILTSVAGADWKPGQEPTDDMRARALNLLSGDVDAFLERDHLNRVAAANNLWTQDNFEDLSLIGIAKEMSDKYGAENLESNDVQESIYQELRARIFQAVMEHEVGHTIGLRHNFAGSYDAMNYHNHFWDHRADKMSENWAQFYSSDSLTVGDLMALNQPGAEALENKITEYQYSTVMDYGGGFNSDIHGTGKYDEAALLMGYAGKVEVFKDLSVAARGVLLGSGETAFPGSWKRLGLDCLPNFEDRITPGMPAMTEQLHYTRLPIIFGTGGTPANTAGVRDRVNSGIANFGPANRELHDYDALDPLLLAESQMRREEGVCDGNPAADLNPDRKVMVPYMFCSDEWRGATASCDVWDQGSDPASISTYYQQNFDNYYWFNNYKRDRWNWSTSAPYQRHMSRFYPNLLNNYQRWLFANWGWGQDQVLGFTWQYAVLDGLNLVGNVFSRPAYGSYAIRPDNGRVAHVSYEEEALGSTIGQVANTPVDVAFHIPRGPGRRPYSVFDYDEGYYYFQKPLEAGHFWDFIGAIQAMSQSSAFALGFESNADVSRFYLPYYTVFGEPIKKLYTGMITDKRDDFAPRVFSSDQHDESGCTAEAAKFGGVSAVGDEGVCYIVVQRPLSDWRGVMDENGAPFGGQWADGKTLPIHNNYTNRFYAALYGMAYFNSEFDQNFAEAGHVWRVAPAEEIEIDEGLFEVHTFTDPRHGFRYATAMSRDEGTEATIGKHFIDEGKEAEERWRTAVSDAEAAQLALDAIEGDYDCDADGAPQACEDLEEAQDEKRAAERTLDNVVAWANRLRSLYSTFSQALRFQ
ncbi:MAG: hypothetical protein CMH55_07275 [Myxococcales bacterium]|nr:hypothetical protein [Myxococcales bacterium]